MIYRRIMPVPDAGDPFVQGLTGATKPKTTQQTPALQRQKPRPDMGGDTTDDADAMAELILQAKRDAEKNAAAQPKNNPPVDSSLTYLREHAPDDVFQRAKLATAPVHGPARFKSMFKPKAEDIRNAADYLQGARVPEDIVDRVKRTVIPQDWLDGALHKSKEEIRRDASYLKNQYAPEDVFKRVGEAGANDAGTIRTDFADRWYIDKMLDKEAKARAEYERKQRALLEDTTEALPDKLGKLDTLNREYGYNVYIPIAGPDGAPNAYGINPRTGKWNIGGYDLTQADKCTLFNICYNGLERGNAACAFVLLKQKNGNLTAEDIYTLGNPTSHADAETAATFLNIGYRAAQSGEITFSDIAADDLAKRNSDMLGIVAIAGTNGFRKGVLGESEKGQPAGKTDDDFKPFDFSEEEEFSKGLGLEDKNEPVRNADENAGIGSETDIFAEDNPISDAKKLSQWEQETAGRMKKENPELDLKEYPNADYDYYDAKTGGGDPYKAQKYDQMGDPGASKYWNPNDFFKAIKWHTMKQNSITEIDLTYFTPEQAAEIEAFVATLSPTEQATIRYIR